MGSLQTMDNYTQFVLKSCKTIPRSQSEAFKDADYANPIECHQKADYDYVWAVLVCLFSLGFVLALFIRF
jgi:hypothetical protein